MSNFKELTNILKGGPGSGQVGHTTAKDETEIQPTFETRLASMLERLMKQKVFEGKETRSGKPLFNNYNDSLKHGYSTEDHRDAGNMHFDAAQKLTQISDKLKYMHKDIPKDLTEAIKFHKEGFKDHFKRAERMDSEAWGADKKHKVKKSTVMLGQADGAEIETGEFAQEYRLAENSTFLEQIYALMDGYQPGDLPRQFPIDVGMLYLVKVDDGMYSGYVKKHDELNDNGEFMIDSAKVRLERMTAPTLVSFLLAKEYLKKPAQTEPLNGEHPPVPSSPEQPIIELNSVLNQPFEEEKDKTIRILELISKLVGV